MVEGSNIFAKLIVTHHMPGAQAALNLYKNIKNPKIKLELDALQQAWNSLQEVALREDNFAKLQQKVNERSENVIQLVQNRRQSASPSNKTGQRKLS